MRRFRARHIIVDGVPRQGWELEVDGDRITRVGPIEDDLGGADVIELGEVALAPGLVNAHSHAFQRAIRGHTEWLRAGRADEDFWTWREAMYGAALSYSPEEVEAVASRAYKEMVRTGITHVGEFHYLHHDKDGSPYEDPNELAHRVIKAARDAGLRITLLRVAYNRAGFQRATDPMQRRFVEPDTDTYIERLEALDTAYQDDPFVTVGLAPHSIRAVPESWLRELSAYAASQDKPLHIHACEQRAEIKQSIAEYGRTPLEVFRDVGLFEATSTLVHATHLSERELGLLSESGAYVCACPTTERNLGDGFLPALALMQRGVPICLGSDSHATIDLWEELRLVEYHERLRYERRNVLAQTWPVWFGEEDGERWDVARLLWPMGNAHGARALGSRGVLEVDAAADFVAVDLEHYSIAGASEASLLSDVVLALKPDAVKGVWVGGAPIFTS